MKPHANPKSLITRGFATGLLEGAAIGMTVAALTGGLGFVTVPIFAVLIAVKRTKDRWFLATQSIKMKKEPDSLKWQTMLSVAIDAVCFAAAAFGLIHNAVASIGEITGIMGGSFAASWIYDKKYYNNGNGNKLKVEKNERSRLWSILAAIAGFGIIVLSGAGTGGLALLVPILCAVAATMTSHGLPTVYKNEKISTETKDYTSTFIAIVACIGMGFILAGFTCGLSIPLALLVAGGIAAVAGVIPYVFRWRRDLATKFSCPSDPPSNETSSNVSSTNHAVNKSLKNNTQNDLSNTGYLAPAHSSLNDKTLDACLSANIYNPSKSQNSYSMRSSHNTEPKSSVRSNKK